MTVSIDAYSSMVVMLQAWMAGLTQKEGSGGVLRRSSPVAVAVPGAFFPPLLHSNCSLECQGKRLCRPMKKAFKLKESN